MEKEISLINSKNTKVRVSSVLDNNGKEFGGNKILDNNADTCWSSDQGNTQTLILEFMNLDLKKFKSIHITSQGGFCPKNISVYLYLEPLSNNSKQIFLKNFDENSIKDTSEVQFLNFSDEDFNGVINNNENINDKKEFRIYGIKLYFDKFYDLYGRVTFYDIKLI